MTPFSPLRLYVTGATVLGLFLASPLATPAFGQKTPNVAGHVISPDKVALADVEVGLEGSEIRIRTDEKGAFSFVDVPSGPHALWFRRIGFMPTRMAIAVPMNLRDLIVTMVPVPATLDTVTVRGRINVLAGVVIDDYGKPVPGATIDVMGTGQATLKSDSSGRFNYTSQRKGPVIFRVRKMGYVMTTQSLRLDDWRGVTLRLETLPTNLTKDEYKDEGGFGNADQFYWRAAQSRLAQRSTRAVIVPNEELTPLGRTSLGAALGQTRSLVGLAAELEALNAEDSLCVIMNGRQIMGNMSLDSFTADQIDFVEVYPPGSEYSESFDRLAMGGVNPCTTHARMRGSIRPPKPYYVVIWTKK